MKLNRLERSLMNNPVRAWVQRHVEAPWLLTPPEAIAGRRVLEVGCGRGVGAQILRDRGAGEVVAFDLDQAMLALARARCRQQGGAPVHLLLASATALPFAAQSFDAVVEFGVLHHIPDWKGALREVARVLRPGGWFFFEEPLKGLIQFPLFRLTLEHPQETQFTGAAFLAGLRAVELAVLPGWRQWDDVGLFGRARTPAAQ
ncbi:MAG: class I SAM-dependent methyltransferase [Chloroflexi bacterium]|nr:class I SAM-dependent methyltransferase [Chloroflexota bacterium]